MSTELFLALCYRCGLSRNDLEDMTIGMCIDFIYEYIDMQQVDTSEGKTVSAVRKAGQADFDAF